MQKISLIAAMAENRVIGLDNQMPWHLPADLQHFKRITMGKPVVMGRLTYESIGRALPGRENIVISRSADYQLADAQVVSSIDAALQLLTQHSEVMIIGGGSIYAATLAQADRLYLTFIDLATEGDTQFPDWTTMGQWQEIDREAWQADEKNPYNYQFVTLERQK